MRLASLILLAACYQARTLSGSPDGAPDTDGAPPLGDGSGTFCFGHRDPICLPAPPSGTISLTFPSTEVALDADCAMFGGTLYPPVIANPTACLFAAASIDVPTGGNPTRVRFTGNLALVLLATDTLRIESGVELSVTSETVGAKGAGAGNQNCDDGSTIDGGGATGAAGGSFGTLGGAGGADKSLASPGQPINAVIPPTILVGGCAGGLGGGALTARANGGGAIDLVTGEGNGSITIAGAVTAHGAGGFGGSVGAVGGNGGGTGGFILLDSPTIQITGTVAALGGAGGQGGGAAAGTDGGTAQGANQALAIANPGAGAGGGNGSRPVGGNGFVGGSTQVLSTGGGGGGGGEGFILHRMVGTFSVGGAKLAPPPIEF